ncbi:MAG TPA: tRNA lysidine(34) synthetase TilS [Candidatus Saccharimonadales bacterium]|nr:tRNA lysidine(34) synthetase TilS [Candidatus Saccharimonadales bacterium]
MNIKIEPGTYVVAVSGGSDSVALLHALYQQSNVKLVVAHYDHGIRDNSNLDRRHVAMLAKSYRLPFIYDQGYLGKQASEAKARKARYEFLHKVRRASDARAIITAHHKDDLLETAILQVLRGTGRRGLGSLRSTDIVKRPALHLTKQDLREYAAKNKLSWREDSTNNDINYLRNLVRHKLIPRFRDSQIDRFHRLIFRAHEINKEADNLLNIQLHLQPKTTELDKKWFRSLSHQVSAEILIHWLRHHNIKAFDKKLIEKLVIGAKTLAVGKTININKEYNLRVKAKVLALEHIER